MILHVHKTSETFIAGVLFSMNAEGILLLVEQSFQFLRVKQVSATVRPVDDECTMQMFTSSQILFCVWESRR